MLELSLNVSTVSFLIDLDETIEEEKAKSLFEALASNESVHQLGLQCTTPPFCDTDVLRLNCF